MSANGARLYRIQTAHKMQLLKKVDTAIDTTWKRTDWTRCFNGETAHMKGEYCKKRLQIP